MIQNQRNYKFAIIGNYMDDKFSKLKLNLTKTDIDSIVALIFDRNQITRDIN